MSELEEQPLAAIQAARYESIFSCLMWVFRVSSRRLVKDKHTCAL